MKRNNVGCGTIIKRWLVFGGIILVLVILAANTGKDKAPPPPAPAVSALQSEDVTPQPTATLSPTATAGPTATPYPTPQPTMTPEPYRVIPDAIRKSLSTSNRKGVTRVHIEVTASEPYIVIITWAINDNLTEGLIKGSAKRDIVLMLKALDETRIPFNKVNLIGTFSLVDTYGNAHETTVVKATYNYNTVRRINWNGFLNDNAYAIADTLWLHRLFQE